MLLAQARPIMPILFITNATMYREAGARRRVYFNPQSTVAQCMLVNQCLSTAARFSVELLNLSVKTQEKDFYSILVLKHNIHSLYKVSRAHFQME